MKEEGRRGGDGDMEEEGLNLNFEDGERGPEPRRVDSLQELEKTKKGICS